MNKAKIKQLAEEDRKAAEFYYSKCDSDDPYIESAFIAGVSHGKRAGFELACELLSYKDAIRFSDDLVGIGEGVQGTQWASCLDYESEGFSTK